MSLLIFQAAQTHKVPSNGTYYVLSETVNNSASLFKSGTSSNPAQNLADHAFEAVTGADNFVDRRKMHSMRSSTLPEPLHRHVSYLIEVRVRELINSTIGTIWGLG